MFLGLAIAYWLVKMRNTWITALTLGSIAGCFAYFFPILAALPIPAESFRRWMWLTSWI